MISEKKESYLGFGRLWNCSKNCENYSASPPSRCVTRYNCLIRKGLRPMFLISITRDWGVVFKEHLKRFEILDATAIPPYYVYTCITCGLSIWIDGFKYQDIMKKFNNDTIVLFNFINCCNRKYFEFSYQFTEPEIGTELTHNLISAMKVLL